MRASGQQLRADAQRNRARILSAARAVFPERGVNTPMEHIARAAGVGVGTLYRRFPDRDALIQAVAVDSIHHLTHLARQAWDQAPDAWSALRRVVLGGGDLMLVFAVVRPHLLDTVRENRELLDAGQAWLDLLAQMVEAAQAQGEVRHDIGPGDIALMLNLLTRPVSGLSGDVAAVVPQRLLELMLDALRPHPTTTLRGSPITTWW